MSSFQTLRALHCALAAVLLMTGGAMAAQKEQPLGLPNAGDLAKVPLGDLAGGAQSNVAEGIDNPTPTDVQAGRQLYIHLNCADCHGFHAKGAMGPSLVDKYWRYGGTPAAIFKSIYEGRPQGMPAWGASLSPHDIWQLVAYIQSLGGTYPPDFYQQSLQGDRKGELVAPELNFEQSIDGSPPYPMPSGANAGAQNEPQTK